jgi:hypothetical protein
VLFSKPPGATVALSSIFAPFWTLAFAGVTLFDSFEIGSSVSMKNEPSGWMIRMK